MNWHDLQHLLALSEHKTLPKAAEAMRVNRTTVSRHIANLETRLNAKLVEKIGRDLALTQSGHEVVSTAQIIEGELQNLERLVFGRDQELAGIIRVTATPVIATMLAGEIAQFGLSHPDLVLEVSATHAIEDLELMESDIAIRFTTNPPANLIAHRIAEPMAAIYASSKQATQLESLDHIDYVDVNLGTRNRDRIQEWITNEFVKKESLVSRTNSMDLAIQLVAAGRGVAVLPCYAADGNSNLVRVSKRRSDILPPVWMLYHPRHRTSARIRAMMEHFVKAFDDLKPMFDGVSGK